MLPTRSVDDVLALIDARFTALPTEEVASADALGRVLAADAIAARDVPPFDRAMSDGLAARSAETVGASSYSPLPLQLATLADALLANGATAVGAGERLPQGADCVVPPEFTQSGPAGTVEILETVAPESEIERYASHFVRGATMLRSGRRLRPSDVALLATAGVDRVTVTRQPRVALVLAAGAAMAGEVESNASILQPLVARDGGALVSVSRVERTALAIRQAGIAAAADIVLVVGGPGRGRDREAGAALADGGKLDVAELALAPGGNLAFGRTGGGSWLFALPGAPVACFWAYEMIVGRAVRGLAGRDAAMPFRQAAMRLTRKLVSAIGMTEVCPVRRHEDGVEPLPGFSPFNLLALGRADGFVVVAEGSEGMPAGTVVPVHLFDDDAVPMTADP